MLVGIAQSIRVHQQIARLQFEHQSEELRASINRLKWQVLWEKGTNG
jgi:hypothetical protein